MLIVYTTFPTQADAKKIGKKLVSDGMVACASVWKADSYFKWKGKLVEQDEWILELKCRERIYRKIEMELKRLHPYELPAIYAFPVIFASREYSRWIDGIFYL